MRLLRPLGLAQIVLGLGALTVGAGAFAVGATTGVLALAIGGLMAATLIPVGGLMIWLDRSRLDEPMKDARELYEFGRPANATVIEVRDVKLEANGVRTARLKLHVTPLNEGSYETTRTVALPGGRVPVAGERVTVKFDPNRRKNVVLLERAYQVQAASRFAVWG